MSILQEMQEAGANVIIEEPAVAETPTVTPPVIEQSLSDPKNFINRELSWLEFNRRVLEEAQDPTQPLIERVKFLSKAGAKPEGVPESK